LDKKNQLKKADFIDYFAYERLGLNAATVNDLLSRIARQIPTWESFIQISFLPQKLKENYIEMIRSRYARLQP
jgi:serine/threonine-protein kinase HipA